MFRAKKCSQLEVRLSRTRQMMSRTEDENQQIRSKVDELRRLIMMQSDVYETCQSRIRKIQREQSGNLFHSDNVLYEKELITKKIEEIVEKNNLEVEDSERLLKELQGYIEREAKASKEFYERQMRETPVFDDSFKENMVAEIRLRALTYAEKKKTEAEIENDLAHIKDAFARLRDEAIGDQSFDDAVAQYIAVESDCIKIMSFIRAKEVEIEVEEEMATKFALDSQAHIAANDILRRKLEEVDVLRRERDSVLEEEDRLKREHGKLNQQMIRWASSLNSVFKAMSVDLEQLGIYGGRVTADADVVMLMGVVEAKSQRVLTAFNKFVTTGGLNRTGTANSSLGGGRTSHGLSDIQTNKNNMLSDNTSPLTKAGAGNSPGGGYNNSMNGGNAGLSLPQILGKQNYGSSNEMTKNGSGSEDEEDYESDEDEMIKPMRSVDLKRSMQASLSGSMNSPMGMGGFA
mmetsp:Transcript_22488/g.26508  ORF Transcript_22488/g.26508 Transcript_22488/m.26508 type:complete len:461 (+) Transcript_22488:350-1732(+)